ncbi:MAG: Gfo/Idh/MocA family oxidoreductase [Eubacteriales bacterium]|nr:Gfo/Idh/MocA family oxidoreductase [Eubacteriales bacterium]
MFKLGFIDYYLDEWHANQYPQWIADASHGDMAVTHAFAEQDSPRGGLSTRAWCEKYNVQPCQSIEELIAACDGIIVLSPDHCERHLHLCEKPLACGKPVYVDKTFAPDLQTAKQIFSFAENSGTPCYTNSALRCAEEYQAIDRKRIHSLCSWGPGVYENYSIHQIEPIMMLMNAPAKRVMALPGEKWSSLVLEFADGRCATMACYAEGSPFAMNLCLEGGNQLIEVKSDFFHTFIGQLVAFFRHPSEVVPHADTLRVMAVRGAGAEALLHPYEWIAVPQ